MRVTNQSLTFTLINNLQRNIRSLDELNYQLSSGKRIRLPSDDPVGAVRVMGYKTYLVENAQFTTNIDDGKGWMESADKAFSQSTEIIQRVRTLAVQAANGTYNAGDRDKIAVEVNQLLDEMVNIGNTSYKGLYIFGGNDTLTSPFEKKYGKDANQDPDLPGRIGINAKNITNVEYKGDTNYIYREIEKNLRLSINFIGKEVFQAENENILSANSGILDYGNYLNAYITNGAGYFKVNDEVIKYNTAKDTLSDIVNKINDSKPGVQAYVGEDDVSNNSVLSSTNTLSVEIPAITSGKIYIMGQEIEIDVNQDSLNSVVSKINAKSSMTGVSASITTDALGQFHLKLSSNKPLNSSTIDEVGAGKSNILSQFGLTDGAGKINATTRNFRLFLESNLPNQIWVQDMTGTLMQNLGVINSNNPPENVAGTHNKLSIFDAFRRFRDDLFNNDLTELYKDIDRMDNALNNVLRMRGEIGARINRFESMRSKMEDYKVNVTELLSKAEDVNMEETIMNLRMLEIAQQAALASGARIIQPTLVNFLK